MNISRRSSPGPLLLAVAWLVRLRPLRPGCGFGTTCPLAERVTRDFKRQAILQAQPIKASNLSFEVQVPQHQVLEHQKKKKSTLSHLSKSSSGVTVPATGARTLDREVTGCGLTKAQVPRNTPQANTAHTPQSAEPTSISCTRPRPGYKPQRRTPSVNNSLFWNNRCLTIRLPSLGTEPAVSRWAVDRGRPGLSGEQRPHRHQKTPAWSGQPGNASKTQANTWASQKPANQQRHPDHGQPRRRGSLISSHKPQTGTGSDTSFLHLPPASAACCIWSQADESVELVRARRRTPLHFRHLSRSLAWLRGSGSRRMLPRFSVRNRNRQK